MACMHIFDPVSSTTVDRDTAGQERFKTLTRTYYRQAKVGVQVLSESISPMHLIALTAACVKDCVSFVKNQCSHHSNGQKN